MDGLEILNKLKKETFYEFSEAIPIFENEIHFIYKVDILSIDINPSETKIDMLKKLIKRHNVKSSISQMDITPIAYILKIESDYQIEAIDKEYTKFIAKNKNILLKEFLEKNILN
ncbi:hypothetical protein [uncultured Methanobrevibacter sp.]|uniref:hypothetical protein n=1 Tax=uncultured Methanobrevibacter sp. TaxID=253161 RepID=UPI0025D94795|nr:hypothetical protein [uncultured Methanobrevibacter sp.]